MSVAKYKLTYVNGRGMAEICRLVFAQAAVDFVDERWTKEELVEKKIHNPFKTVPCLEVDGKKFNQGSAISRFLAREFGMMGSNNMETLRIEEIQECLVDLRTESVKIFREPDEAKKEELRAAISEGMLPKVLEYLMMRLKENGDGNGFFVGDKLSYADLIVYRVMEMCELSLKTEILNDALKAHRDRVTSQPRIADWLKKRPVTDF